VLFECLHDVEVWRIENALDVLQRKIKFFVEQIVSVTMAAERLVHTPDLAQHEVQSRAEAIAHTSETMLRAVKLLLKTQEESPDADFWITLRMEFMDNRCIIAISNEGRGISPEEQGRLFQPYSHFSLKLTGNEDSSLEAVRWVFESEEEYISPLAQKHYEASGEAIRRAGLTTLELRIASLLKEPNGDIAELLGLSEKTVRNYLSVIYAKLRATSRFEAIKWAERCGVLEYSER
jgi:DNA-binding NarL/FixJ family response regulator